jgi:predicted alternative tryptophan synthase beta-subunit
MILPSTPVESYEIESKKILVKREDLCAPDQAPPFSKIRGLYDFLKRKKEEGIKIVGYTETSISMAGWGVAWACDILGMRSVIFDPQYKKEIATLSQCRFYWSKYNSETIPIPAGRAKVNYYICRKKFYDKYPKNSLLLPLGLPLNETMELTKNEAEKTLFRYRPKTIVCCVGSGTIFAGLVRAFYKMDVKLIGVLCRKGNIANKTKDIVSKSKIVSGGLFGTLPFHLYDESWEYTEASNCPCPFPTHPYYDLKAWEWLTLNHAGLRSPIAFWNIGRLEI